MNSTIERMNMRNSGFRIVFIGLFSLILAFIIYSRLTSPSEQTTMIIPELRNLAYAILAITFASLISIAYGISRILKAERHGEANPGSTIYYIATVFSDNKYLKIMIISSIGYGIIFGFLSQIFVYKNNISFIDQGIMIPSVNIVPCCNIPGYVPMFTAYITDHFLVLLIPINIILAVTVSALVGFNFALSFYILKLTRISKNKISIFQSIGLTGGLFVGCPTCAGSIFSALLGFGAGTTIAVLALFQTLFIAITIPVLIITPLFMIHKIQRKYSGC
ncbi:MAG: hypothetical protein WB053_05645 [Nitrososphaeraceae archaeon]|jgi:hypothetical protein